ncbi:MAG: hypothetical protein HUN04_19750 [Desulfobacter sp.]|nr:MAG: hypothetical protein HUN04_19750 [Desulfobacter sp.]
MKLPVVKETQSHFPKEPKCPICGKRKVFEPHSFAVLSAGALLMNRKDDSGGPSDNMDGFLNIGWHGAHDSGEGEHREIGCYVDIFRDVFGGQANAYFCSTECLRTFLNECVDALEKRINQEEK